MWIFIKLAIAWIFTNAGVIVGIVEAVTIGVEEILTAVVKALSRFVHATPSKRDDGWLSAIQKIADYIILWTGKFFSWIKKACYTISDLAANRPEYKGGENK